MSKFPQHLAFLKSLASGAGKPPAKRSATGAENLGIPKPSKLPRNGLKKKDLFKERVESDDNDGDSQQRFETEASMYNPAPYKDHLVSASIPIPGPGMEKLAKRGSLPDNRKVRGRPCSI